jgi:hypothetical protein
MMQGHSWVEEGAFNESPPDRLKTKILFFIGMVLCVSFLISKAGETDIHEDRTSLDGLCIFAADMMIMMILW